MATWTARDILDSIDEGNLRLAMAKAEAEEEAQAQMQEEKAGNDAAWAAIIARIKDSIPQWAWQYLSHPNRLPTFRSEHVTMIVPATIDLGQMGQVFAYAYTDLVFFAPAEWHLQGDGEAWSVQPSNGRSESVYSLPGNADFLIALAQAYANMESYAVLQAEADQRNADRQKPPATVQRIDWLALASRWMVFDTPVPSEVEKAKAYALIGILEQLRMVTTPLYNGREHAIQIFDQSFG